MMLSDVYLGLQGGGEQGYEMQSVTCAKVERRCWRSAWSAGGNEASSCWPRLVVEIAASRLSISVLRDRWRLSAASACSRFVGVDSFLIASLMARMQESCDSKSSSLYWWYLHCTTNTRDEQSKQSTRHVFCISVSTRSQHRDYMWMKVDAGMRRAHLMLSCSSLLRSDAFASSCVHIFFTDSCLLEMLFSCSPGSFPASLANSAPKLSI